MQREWCVLDSQCWQMLLYLSSYQIQGARRHLYPFKDTGTIHWDSYFPIFT